MHEGRYVFAQLMRHLPLHAFRHAVTKYDGDRYVKRFSCLDQFLCMAFAQLTERESLRDIEVCLRAHHAKQYHLGIRGAVARSTLADANEKRDWHIFAEIAPRLIATARRLYVDEPLASSWRKQPTRWIQRPSSCACRCSLGRGLRMPAAGRSSCTRCSTFAAPSRP